MLNENLARFTFSLVHFSISEIVTGEWESSGEARKNGDKFLETWCLWLLEKRRYLERAAENWISGRNLIKIIAQVPKAEQVVDID
jgi:hypothetical protein